VTMMKWWDKKEVNLANALMGDGRRQVSNLGIGLLRSNFSSLTF